MYRNVWHTIRGWLAGTLGALALVLALAGSALASTAPTGSVAMGGSPAAALPVNATATWSGGFGNDGVGDVGGTASIYVFDGAGNEVEGDITASGFLNTYLNGVQVGGYGWGSTTYWTNPTLKLYITGSQVTISITGTSNQGTSHGPYTYTGGGLSSTGPYTGYVTTSGGLTSSSISTVSFVPTNLTITSNTQTSLVLGWTGAQNATSYNLYDNGTQIGTTTALSYTFSGLSPSTSYTLGVAAVGSGNSTIQTISGTTLAIPPPPAAPTGVALSGISTDAATLTWTDSGAAGYVATLNDTAQVIDLPAGSSSVVFHGLTAGTSYKFSVAAVDSWGQTGAYASVTAPTVPAAVTGLSVTATNTSQTAGYIVTTWQTAGGAAGYDVTVAGTTYQVTGTTYQTGSMAPGTYSIQVMPYDSSGTGPTVTAYATITPPPAPGPSGVALNGISTDAATLVWTDSGAVGGYILTLDSVQVGTVPAGSSSFVYHSLNAGTSYTFAVAAVDGTGQVGGFSAVAAPTVPAAVTGLTATGGAGPGILTATWTPPGGVTGYDLAINGKEYQTTGTSYAFSGLTDGQSYTLTVTPYNSSGTGPAASVSGTPYELPGPVTGLIVKSGLNVVTLHWTAAIGADYYSIVVGDPTTYTTTNTTYTVAQTTNSAPTPYTVTPVNSYGSGTSATITTTNPPPAVASTFTLPGLADAGIWTAITTLLADYWPILALAVVLILFPALVRLAVKLIRSGSQTV